MRVAKSWVSTILFSSAAQLRTVWSSAPEMRCVLNPDEAEAVNSPQQVPDDPAVEVFVSSQLEHGSEAPDLG